MSGQNLRYLQQTQFSRIEHDLVLTRMGKLSIRDIEAVIRGIGFHANGKSAAIIEGLIASPGALLSVDLSIPAVVAQKVDADNVRYAVDYNGNNPFNIVLDPADPTNPRVDIIEGRIREVSAFTDTVVDVVNPITHIISPATRDRDFEISLEIFKRTGTPAPTPVPVSPTVGTAAEITGTVAIPTTIDLSAEWIINFAIGRDSSFVEVDCRGAVPAATTKAEIVTALNAAGFGAVASISGNFIKITAPGTGDDSLIQFKQPVSPTTDGLDTIFGLTESPGYFFEYRGENAFFKIAEILVPALATTLTNDNVRSREEKDTTWQSDAATIINGVSIQSHRESIPADHEPASIEDYHLAGSAVALVQSKPTRIAGITNLANTANSKFYMRQRSYPIQTVSNANQARMQTFAPTKLTLGTNVPLMALTDDAGVDLDYERVESQYPLSRVDNKEEDTSGSYSVLTSLSEAAANKILFQPTATVLYSTRFKRFAVFVKNKGTGYTDLTFDFHDPANNLLFSLSIPYASVNDNAGAGAWNYVSHGLLDNIYLLDAATVYHAHVYVTGFGIGTTPILGRSAGSIISHREMYRPIAGTGFLDDKARPYLSTLDISQAVIDAITENGVNDDDTTMYASETKFDIMSADFSSDSFWESFSYNNYIIVDVKTGRIKIPTNFNPFKYFWSFNTKRKIADLDTGVVKVAGADSATNPTRETYTVQQLLENLKFILQTGWPTGSPVETYEDALGVSDLGRRRITRLRYEIFNTEVPNQNIRFYIELRMVYANTSDLIPQYIDAFEVFDGTLITQLGLPAFSDGIKIGRIEITDSENSIYNW